VANTDALAAVAPARLFVFRLEGFISANGWWKG